MVFYWFICASLSNDRFPQLWRIARIYCETAVPLFSASYATKSLIYIIFHLGDCQHNIIKFCTNSNAFLAFNWRRYLSCAKCQVSQRLKPSLHTIERDRSLYESSAFLSSVDRYFEPLKELEWLASRCLIASRSLSLTHFHLPRDWRESPLFQYLIKWLSGANPVCEYVAKGMQKNANNALLLLGSQKFACANRCHPKKQISRA